MATATFNVSEIRNAGFGDFVAVSVEIDGRECGCDAHLGTGDAREGGSVDVELFDWEDGNGLVGNGHATAAEVWDAVRGAGHVV